VVIVAPFFRPNTLRYINALVRLPGVRLSVLSCDHAGALAAQAPVLAQQVQTVVPVARTLDGRAIIAAAQQVIDAHGPIDRLLGILEQLQLPLGEARSALSIAGMSAEVAFNFRDKARMKDVLREAGLDVARHCRVTSLAEGLAFGARVGFPMVLKPVAGVGAKATVRVSNNDELRSVLHQFGPSESEPVQAEEFITGVERTLEAVLVDGQPVWWSGTRYAPSPLQTLENPWMQYTVTLPGEECSPWTDFVPTSIRALQALGLKTGLSHMEWFETADGRHVIGEVGARPPGVNIMPLMSHVFGHDMVAAWCQLMVLGSWPTLARQQAAGSAFFRAQGEGERIVSVTGLSEAQQEVGQWVVDRKLPRIGARPADGYVGDGWAIVAAPTTPDVWRALGTLVRTVRVQLG
jgi:biotin carboxylase